MHYLLTNLQAVQVDVALIGLTFNHESEGAVGLNTGPVNITSLEQIIPGYWGDPSPSFSDQKYAAHLYGMSITPQTPYLLDRNNI